MKREGSSKVMNKAGRLRKTDTIRYIIGLAIILVCIISIFSSKEMTATARAAGRWGIGTHIDAFEHVIKSNGRIEYDYDNDGDLSGENDVVLDAEDIKALDKKTEVTLFGNFVPDKDEYGDGTGTGTLYIRIGDNPQ